MKKSSLVFDLIINFLQIIFILISVFLVVYFFIAQLLEVTGDSMYPNFHDKEQIVAEKISVKKSSIKRGDVVIFKHPFEDKLLIKRVIGLPGETFEIKDGFIYINGEKLNEPYLSDEVKTKGHKLLEEGPQYKIRDDSYVVLGDNREESTDSREWGYVDEELLKAKGVFVYYPLSNIRFIKSVTY